MYEIYQYDINYNDRLLFTTLNKTIASQVCIMSSFTLYYVKKKNKS